MSEHKFTPGPWHAEPWNSLPNGYVYGPAPPYEQEQPPPGLMKCYPPASFRWDDAALIAKSPELFAMLERLTSVMIPRNEAENRLMMEAVALLRAIDGGQTDG